MMKPGDKVTVMAQLDLPPAPPEKLEGKVFRVWDDREWFDLEVEVIEQSRWGKPYKAKRIYNVKKEWVKC